MNKFYFTSPLPALSTEYKQHKCGSGICDFLRINIYLMNTEVINE